MMMANVPVSFLVMIGAGLGGLLRYGTGRTLAHFQAIFPFATLVSNVASSFLVGLFYGYLSTKNPDNEWIKPLLITGLCGGFSTFSSFSYENLQLLSENKPFLALCNIVANLVICLLATWAGMVSLK